MAFALTRGVALIGVRGHLFSVEADVGLGLPSFHMIGLPDGSLPQTRDRVRAAVINSGWAWPDGRISVSLSPLSTPKRGACVDLAIAVALLAAMGEIPSDGLADVLLLGELGLNGAVRPVRGVLSAVSAAAAEGITTVVVPEANAAEAARVPGIVVIPAGHLAELVDWLKSGDLGSYAFQPPAAVPYEPGTSAGDLADVPGNHAARHAVEVSAAGGHNLFLWGQPGGAGTMLVHRMAELLPALDPQSERELAEIYSLVGEPAPVRPPLIAPHHTSTPPAVFGGGTGVPRPGAVSRAHRGLLFLDDAPEFPVRILDQLRQPLTTGEVVIASGEGTIRLPARFMLALVGSTCPCSWPTGRPCDCTPAVKRRYVGRLGRLLQHVEVRARTERPGVGDDVGNPESSTAVAARVQTARERATARLAKTPWRTNAEVPFTALRASFRADLDALDVLLEPLNAGLLTEPRVPSVLRVAWTLADLRGADRPGRDDVTAALGLATAEPVVDGTTGSA